MKHYKWQGRLALAAFLLASLIPNGILWAAPSARAASAPSCTQLIKENFGAVLPSSQSSNNLIQCTLLSDTSSALAGRGAGAESWFAATAGYRDAGASSKPGASARYNECVFRGWPVTACR